MHKKNRTMKLIVLLSFIYGLLGWTTVGRTADLHAYMNTDFTATPPFVSAGAPPLVMLVMERDDKLYSPAYNDASDLTEDTVLDVGFKPAIMYYGYFDSNKCYAYSNGQFNPKSVIPTADGGKCNQNGNTGEWQGNWLNYVTMSRMDALRRVLYGGFRSQDTTSATILRRTYIPQDAHSWGKEYESETRDGYKISDYTPLSLPTTVGLRHLFANTTLSNNGTPLLRVLENSDKRIWDWVAKEAPEADNSLTKDLSYNYSGYPANHTEFEDLITEFATGGTSSSHYLGQNTPATINQGSPGNPFPNSHASSSNYYINVIKGSVRVKTAGDYSFACDGDDAVEVMIDGVNIAGWYGSHTANEALSEDASRIVTVNLTAGVNHSIEFRHQEKDGSDSYYLRWKGPDSGNIWKIVPQYTTTNQSGLRNLVNTFYDVYTTATNLTDYTVQVKVCDSSIGLEDNCKEYKDGATSTYKPTGLLQRYGESDSMYFGLITGSYLKNTSGGVLRKNIGSIKDEIDPKTGIIIDPAISNGGWNSGNSKSGSIITTINKFRVAGYDYGTHSYPKSTGCGWITNRPIAEGECRMWGNPIGEMMYETLNYFSGTKTATSNFTYTSSTDDDSLLLPHPAWNNPYDTDKTQGGHDSCSKPFMLVLSDVNPSFDSNSVPGANSSFTPAMAEAIVGPDSEVLNVTTLGNFISSKEGIPAGQYYIGNNTILDNGICSAKDITGFGDIRGLCPEEPTKQGSYSAAAVAYFGRTHDINSANGDQNVITYAVGLASPLPKITIPVGTNTITLVPFGKSVWWNDECTGDECISPASNRYQPTNSIAAFFVETLAPPYAYGKFRINFEDSEQGADHDQDALVVYEYQVVDSGGNPVTDPVKDGKKVKITLTSTAASGGIIQHMGYVISGTTADKTYLDVRDYDLDQSNPKVPLGTGSNIKGADVPYYLDTPNPDNPAMPAIKPDGSAYTPYGATYQHLPLKSVRTFEPSGTAPATILKDPLWYAAKYGGFETENTLTSTYVPTATEWDKDDNKEPDTYFFVVNPLKLESQLNKSFSDMLRRVSSGTAASVISNSRSGEGAVYQATFFAKNQDGNIPPNMVTWVGDVNALFVDKNGNIREDTNGDGQLNVVVNNTPSNPATDCGDLMVVYDGTDIKKYSNCKGDSILDTTKLISTNMAIKYIWRAGNWLNNTVTDPLVQRTDYAPATADTTYAADLKRRYIFTFIDYDKDMVNTPSLSPNEQQPFVCTTIPTTATELKDPKTIFPYLNVYPPFQADAGAFETIRQLYSATTNPNTAPFLDFLGNQSCRQINYIRGQDQDAYSYTSTVANGSFTIPAYRSRQFDYNFTGTKVTWRLGDIVYSTPTIVGRPSEAYHLIYKDYTYADFLDKYMNRRGVVYVGGNDGMLHAFNAGFYDSKTQKFGKQPIGYTLEPYTDSNKNKYYDYGEPLSECGTPNGIRDKTCSATDAGISAFDLGAELWAYVPFNLLPHLLWLTAPNYSHVYYVDQKPRVFDARIFFNSAGTEIDSDHPKGWGTVMVVGMRLGGGTVYADMDKTDGLAMNSAVDVKMSSAYIIMDITNPEKPPRVLAELKFPELGYTTCYPGVIPMSVKGGSTSLNDWYLVFGSGPAESNGSAGKTTETSLRDVASAQSAKLYVVDLKALGNGAPVVKTIDTTGNDATYVTSTTDPITKVITTTGYQEGTPGYYKALDTKAFISDPITADWQLDFQADAVYFGTISGDPVNHPADGWNGKLRRIAIATHPNSTALPDNSLLDRDTTTWIGDSILLDDEYDDATKTGYKQPITAAVNLTTDTENNRWVYFGTGRFFTRVDAKNKDEQTYYGVKEPEDASRNPTWGTVLRSQLLDVSDALVYDKTIVKGVTGATDWDSLVDLIDGKSGWMLNLKNHSWDPVDHTGERNLGQAALLGGALLFTTYIPSDNVCTFEGSSLLYAEYYTTGTPYFKPIIGKNLLAPTVDEKNANLSFLSLGIGLATTPNVHVQEDGSRAFVQDSSGKIHVIDIVNPLPTKSGVRSWLLNED